MHLHTAVIILQKQLQLVVSYMIMVTDNESITGLALLDLSAIFDIVDHTILSHRLFVSHHIAGRAPDWFANYLLLLSLLHPYQTAYSKNQSTTKTTLLSLHDHLSNAIAHQQVSCLCLLDLPAAFDTLDRSILLTHLSTWFGISSISLS